MNRRKSENVFDRHRVPAPPDSLERRTLDAAAAALRAESEATIWDRLWKSRGLRLAWWGATLALLTAHVAMSLAPDGSVTRSARIDSPNELREILALPTVDISSRAAGLALERRAMDSAAATHPAKSPDRTPDRTEVPL